MSTSRKGDSTNGVHDLAGLPPALSPDRDDLERYNSTNQTVKSGIGSQEKSLQSIQWTMSHASDMTSGSQPASSAGIVRPTLKRYVILFLFCINSGNKSFQWIQIPASTTKLTYYYGVDNFVINALSVIFMLSLIVMSLPACCIIKRIGLRNAVLIGSFGTAVGSIIKFFAYKEDRIALLFFGSTLVSLSEQFIFSVPSRLASVWFPDSQVSSAVGMSVLGAQLGIALGFVIPQYMLDSAETKPEIELALYWMFAGVAALSVFSFLADLVMFDEAPKHAPGAARLKQIEQEQRLKMEQQVAGIEDSFRDEVVKLSKQLAELVTNKNLMILTVSYGINLGVNYSMVTILDQTLIPLWPNANEGPALVGNTGFLIIICGALGCALWGRLMDVTHKYWLINLALLLGTIGSLFYLAYAITGLHSATAIQIAGALIGLFHIGSTVSGLELAVEYTYPVAEMVTSSLMNISPQVFGIIQTFVASYIVDTYGALATNLFYLICLFISLGLLFCVSRSTLKRQSAVNASAKLATGYCCVEDIIEAAGRVKK